MSINWTRETLERHFAEKNEELRKRVAEVINRALEKANSLPVIIPMPPNTTFAVVELVMETTDLYWTVDIALHGVLLLTISRDPDEGEEEDEQKEADE